MAEHLDTDLNDFVRACLADLRSRGMSQTKIGEVVGLSQVQVGRIMGGSGTTYKIAAAIARAAGREPGFTAITGGIPAAKAGAPAYLDPELERAMADGGWSNDEISGARGYANAAKPRWTPGGWTDWLQQTRRIEQTEALKRAMAETMQRGISASESTRHAREMSERVREQVRSREPRQILTAPIVEYHRGRQK